MAHTRDYSVFVPLKPHELERLLERRHIDENGCWLWTGGKDASGYACAVVRGKDVRVHRLMYEAMVGHIPEGLVIDHLCRVRACINPAHLEAVTQSTNVRRGVRHAGIHHHFGRRTHCKHGHLLLGDNVRLVQLPSGAIIRVCRACMKNNKLARRRRKHEAAVQAPPPVPTLSTSASRPEDGE